MNRAVVPLLLVLFAAAAGIWFLMRPSGTGPVVGSGEDEGRDTSAAPTLAKAPTTPKRAPPPGTATDAPAGPEPEAPGDVPLLTGNVLDDETGKPVAGAVVVVAEPQEPCPREPDAALFAVAGADAETPALTIVTARGGPGQPFKGVQRGQVRTGASGAFSIPWRFPKADVLARSAGYVVASACHVDAAAPLTIRLKRGLTIEGFVVTADGKPVEGALLAVRPAPGVPREPGHVEQTTSDARGHFLVGGLVRGPVILVADHPRFMPQALEPMEPGRKDVRIVLVPALMVSVTIRTDDAKAPDAPSIAWRTSGQPPREGLQLLEPTEVPALSDLPLTTGAPKPPDGSFAYAPLRVPCDRPDVGFTVKAIGCSPWVSERVELPREGGETKLDVALVKDPTLGNLKVILEDRDRNPLSYVTERCQVQMGRRDGKPVPAGVILKPGDALEVPALPAGPYLVIVRSPTHAPARSDVEVASIRETELRLTLGPPAKLRVKFRAPEVMIVKFHLTQGREIALPFVEGLGADAGPEDDGSGDQALPAGSDGALLTGLAAGRYTVEVISPELSAPPTVVDLTEGDTKEVEISVTRK